MITAETLAGPILSLVLGYLLGSIPFGIVLTRMTGAGDLRRIGSGNIGATNVLRTGRKGLAAATLVLDALKATAAVLIAQQAWGLGALAAIGAFLGHLWPVWLRFRGGKGVATLLGLMIGLHWPSAIVYAAIWLGTLGATRISSLAGMLAGISAPIAAGLFGRIDLAVLFLGFALLLLRKHRENVARLIAGTEPRIGRAGDA